MGVVRYKGSSAGQARRSLWVCPLSGLPRSARLLRCMAHLRQDLSKEHLQLAEGWSMECNPLQLGCLPTPLTGCHGVKDEDRELPHTLAPQPNPAWERRPWAEHSCLAWL